MTTYTSRLNKSQPDIQVLGWHIDWYRNQNIDDVVIGQDMQNNFVVSGGDLSGASGLSININATEVEIAGTRYTVSAQALSLTGASVNPEETNWIYVSAAGAITVSTSPPTATDFCAIGLVDTDATTVLRTADFRRYDSSGYETPVENDCINGTFQVWEYATSQTTSGYGSDNRWSNDNSGTTKVHSRQSFTPGQTVVPGNPLYYSRTVVTSVAGVSNYCKKTHKILDVTKYSGQRICVVFYGSVAVAKDIAVEVAQNFGSGGSATVFGIDVQTVSLTTTLTKHVLYFDIPDVTGKTIGTLSYIEISFWFDAGSDFNARTNSLGQQSGTFNIAEVQTYQSSKELPVRRKPAIEELRNCLDYRRYYVPVLYAYPIYNSTTTLYRSLVLRFDDMIQAPSVTFTNAGWAATPDVAATVNSVSFAKNAAAAATPATVSLIELNSEI